jgi:hypothetical protein
MIIGKEKAGQIIEFVIKTHDNNGLYFLNLESINGIPITKHADMIWISSCLQEQVKSPKFNITGIIFKQSDLFVTKKFHDTLTTVYFYFLAAGNMSLRTKVIMRFTREHFNELMKVEF